MNDYNRALVALGSRLAAQEQVGEELKDIRNHWADWRFEWEHKLQQNEMQFLRCVADLQGGFQHRATLMDANYRDAMRGQHAEFTGALERFSLDIQKRLWADLERIRLDYERLIYSELKTIRQRAAVTSAGGSRGSGAGSRRRRCRWASTTAASRNASAAPRNTSRRASSSTCRYFRGLPQRARYRLRARRVSGNDARGRCACEGHRPRRGIGGDCAATRDSTPRWRICSCIWRICRKPRWTASSVRRWWSTCRRSACRRWSACAPAGSQRNGVIAIETPNPGVPGDLRHALLSGPHAPAAGAASAAGVLSGGVRRGKYRGPEAFAGGGIDALSEKPPGGFPGGFLRRPGLRDSGQETLGG